MSFPIKVTRLEWPSISIIIDIRTLRAYSIYFYCRSTLKYWKVTLLLVSSFQHWYLARKCVNVSNIFIIQNSRSLKTYFFLDQHLQIFLVKQVSWKNYSFNGLSLCHLNWFSSSLGNASISHKFCIIKMSQNVLNSVWFNGIYDPCFWKSLKIMLFTTPGTYSRF